MIPPAPVVSFTGTAPLVLAAGSALLLSALLTPLVRAGAARLGWLDRPDGGRKGHARPVPRPGGVAVHAAFTLAALLTAVLPGTSWAGPGLHLLAASSCVMLVGLLDDVRGTPPWMRLLVQVVAALYLYQHGYQVRLLTNPFGEEIDLGAASLPVTLLWFVLISNAFNLVDGLDGLACGMALFASSVMFIVALINERWDIALLTLALLGALVGFLRYNFSPASVFLGDSGALFTGFLLAALSIRGSMKHSTAIAIATPLLALGVPLLDTALAVVRRLAGGRSILEADAEHLHHRMVRRGLTPQQAVTLLYGVAALFAGMALLALSGRAEPTGLAVVCFSVVTWAGVRMLRPRRPSGSPQPLSRRPPPVPS